MANNHVFNDLMGDYGRRVMTLLGAEWYDGDGPNPITEAIRQGRGDELVNGTPGGSEIQLSIAASCAQMMKLNREQGPEGDGKPKALRRHWYSWYKAEFAQPLALALGQFEITGAGVKQMDDRKWSSLLSKTYGRLVDTGQVTYTDLWVEDASRMMRGFWEQLFSDANIAVAVEKDSLFGDFVAAAQALGAKALISGKGKQSKAATEKMLRDHFEWEEGWSRFSAEKPLRVITITDYDYHGEAVIEPTFGTQARRYTRHVDEARIGIQPTQVPADEWGTRSYRVKVGNRGERDWAAAKALFSVGCTQCGHNWMITGLLDPITCPECFADRTLVNVHTDRPTGFEVEALTTRTFYPHFVDALLTLMPFGEIVEKLRDECRPDPYNASDRVTDELLEKNDAYQETLAEMQTLQESIDGFRGRVNRHIYKEAEGRRQDYYDMGDDPSPDDFRGFVREATDGTNPWRPFSRDDRTQALIEDLREDPTVREVLDWTFEAN